VLLYFHILKPFFKKSTIFTLHLSYEYIICSFQLACVYIFVLSLGDSYILSKIPIFLLYFWQFYSHIPPIILEIAESPETFRCLHAGIFGYILILLIVNTDLC